MNVSHVWQEFPSVCCSRTDPSPKSTFLTLYLKLLTFRRDSKTLLSFVTILVFFTTSFDYSQNDSALSKEAAKTSGLRHISLHVIEARFVLCNESVFVLKKKKTRISDPVMKQQTNKFLTLFSLVEGKERWHKVRRSYFF